MEELGADVSLSPPTNKKILDEGTQYCTNDACLPVKLFFGHVCSLEGRVDRILVPNVMSVEKKEYGCPFICGLPEMLRFSRQLKTPFAVLKMDYYKSESIFYRNFEDFGLFLVKDKTRIRNAFRTAFGAYRKHGIFPNFNNEYFINKPFCQINKNGCGTIGVLAHPYVLYDQFISNLDLIRQNGFSILTPEMIEPHMIEYYASELPKKMFWSCGKRLYGSAVFMCEANVSGILYLSAFGCGVDSIMADLSERAARKTGIPYMLLTFDEHTGETGFKTRLEAFLDMVKGGIISGSYLSSHGKYLYSVEGDI